LEIDGASNRGIDEIRQLRANAAVRPSRSPNKIYIIDEVHMLTKEAFNALLKTLEEPPAHVKFIFCTTDPEKIPITVLSRCQRFDFSPVQTTEIAARLKLIANEEGVAIDEQALALMARRANGSMRDSQSLLEQMLSFCDKEIGVDDVHQLLGTADIGRIADIAKAFAAKDSALALNLIHEGIFAGIDAGQMVAQLLGYFRDMMAVRVGSHEETLLNCSPQDLPVLKQLADQFGLETILTITQVLDSTVVKMQHSLHGRTLLEIAAVRICNLEHLDSMADLVASLRQGGAAPAKRARVQPSGKKMEMRQVDVAPPKKKQITEPVPVDRVSTQEPSPRTASEPNEVSAAAFKSDSSKKSELPSTPPPNVYPKSDQSATQSAATIFKTHSASQVWEQVTQKLDGMTSDMAKDFQKVELAEPQRLVVTLADKVNKDFCSKPERKQLIEDFLAQVAGEQIKVDFLAAKKDETHETIKPKLTRVQQIRQLEGNDFVSNAMSIFDAEITGFKEGRRRT
jgi:DNA polymerase-3 subunit gamma/tau